MAPELRMEASPILIVGRTTRGPSLAECSGNTHCLSGVRPFALTHTVACEYDGKQILTCSSCPKIHDVWQKDQRPELDPRICLFTCASADKLEAKRRPGGTPMDRPLHISTEDSPIQ